eukprot:GHVP01053736.1.p2 GENE.GHVP01053736.1~~GHVP01053736.1.p2  ORF type:complete len:221 (+),score=76.46 GHVP01053736.1:1087-1749(+)
MVLLLEEEEELDANEKNLYLSLSRLESTLTELKTNLNNATLEKELPNIEKEIEYALVNIRNEHRNFQIDVSSLTEKGELIRKKNTEKVKAVMDAQEEIEEIIVACQDELQKTPNLTRLAKDFPELKKFGFDYDQFETDQIPEIKKILEDEISRRKKQQEEFKHLNKERRLTEDEVSVLRKQLKEFSTKAGKSEAMVAILVASLPQGDRKRKLNEEKENGK